jgi:hypothetical protein
MSTLLRLRDVHGIEATYYCILNEAGNDNSFDAATVQKMIKALGPKMEAAGLRTKIQFPECVNADTCWTYVTNTQTDAEMWSHVGLVSYHLYGPKTQLQTMRDFAWGRGLPMAQTEFNSVSTSVLYDDVTTGGVSYWEHYGIGQAINFTGANYNRVVRATWYWPLRQLLHYVRCGDFR